MPKPSVLPTAEQLVKFVGAHEGAEFETLDRGNPFQAFVKSGVLYVRPLGGKDRRARDLRLNDVLSRLSETGSWRPSDYQDLSFNSSYLLALVRAWQAPEPRKLKLTSARIEPKLSEEQREELKTAVWNAIRHRSCELRDDRLLHGFEIRNNFALKKKWIGSIYWSENNAGNDVEIALDLPRLARTTEESTLLVRWVRSTALELWSDEPRNHSGNDESWFRAGFRFSEAIDFFRRLASRTSPLISDRGRWAIDEAPSGLGPEAEAGLAAQGVEQGSLAHMLSMARQACSQSGQERTTITKTKQFLFSSDAEFLTCVSDLLKQQQNRCAVTGLELQLLGGCDDEERLASLDRINSDGDYSPENLQVVCRFINRWKSDDSDENFRRLIRLLDCTVAGRPRGAIEG